MARVEKPCSSDMRTSLCPEPRPPEARRAPPPPATAALRRRSHRRLRCCPGGARLRLQQPQPPTAWSGAVSALDSLPRHPLGPGAGAAVCRVVGVPQPRGRRGWRAPVDRPRRLADAGQLRERLIVRGWDHRIVNLGVNGARVEDVLDRQLPALESLATDGQTPTLVTVVIGSNDVVMRRHRRGLVERFAAMLDRLPEGALVSNLPNPHREARAVDAMLRARADAGHLVLVDMRRDGPRSWRGRLASDKFHPNDR